jgi:hypothetical protein
MRYPSIFNPSGNIDHKDMNRYPLTAKVYIDGTFGTFKRRLAGVFYKLSTPVDNLIG